MNRMSWGREGFPAHVYYGRSLLDQKNLSIVIDYRKNQDIGSYRPNVDWIVNEEGLGTRDEIRQVKKRLYLGRAYDRGRFVLNFVLQK